MDSNTVMSSGFPPGQKNSNFLSGCPFYWWNYAHFLTRTIEGRNSTWSATRFICLMVPLPETLTSYIQPIVTCKLCERRHVVGVVGQDVGLLCDALSGLLDALIVCVLRNDNKHTRIRWEACWVTHLSGWDCHTPWVSLALGGSCSQAYCQIARR